MKPSDESIIPNSDKNGEVWFCKTCGKQFSPMRQLQAECEDCENLKSRKHPDEMPVEAAGNFIEPESSKCMPVINPDEKERDKDYPYPGFIPVSDDEKQSDDVTKCPYCGSDIHTFDRFCGQCGSIVNFITQTFSM